jgi:hypothetical protein
MIDISICFLAVVSSIQFDKSRHPDVQYKMLIGGYILYLLIFILNSLTIFTWYTTTVVVVS